jgi:hypothetical protein
MSSVLRKRPSNGESVQAKKRLAQSPQLTGLQVMLKKSEADLQKAIREQEIAQIYAACLDEIKASAKATVSAAFLEDVDDAAVSVCEATDKVDELQTEVHELQCELASAEAPKWFTVCVESTHRNYYRVQACSADAAEQAYDTGETVRYSESMPSVVSVQQDS